VARLLEQRLKHQAGRLPLVGSATPCEASVGCLDEVTIRCVLDRRNSSAVSAAPISTLGWVSSRKTAPMLALARSSNTDRSHATACGEVRTSRMLGAVRALVEVAFEQGRLS
jgi:hypothetical protein